MPNHVSSLAVATALAASIIVTTQRAHAEEKVDKKACVESFEKAQSLRKDGKLLESREQLAVCSRPGCPTLVRGECSRWAGEVDNAIPSVVPSARDAQGRDVQGAELWIDGAVVEGGLAGKALPLNPGTHSARVEAPGMTPAEQSFALADGQRLVLDLTMSPPPPTAPMVAPYQPTISQPSSRSGAPVLPFVLMGVGAASLGAAVFLRIDTGNDVAQLRESCAPRCQESDVDAAKSKYTASLVFFGVGAAAVGAGVVLLVTRPTNKSGTTAQLRVAPTPGGAALGFAGKF